METSRYSARLDTSRLDTSRSNASDVTKRRVMNGHGIRTSLWSTTHLGGEDSNKIPYQMPIEAYRAEASQVSMTVKQQHGPALRSKHMQKAFPETRRLMQPPHGRLAALQTPRELKDVTFPPHNMHRTRWERDDKPASATNPEWCRSVASGHRFGDGHRKALTKKANDTSVNYIISQQDKSGKPFRPGFDLLFPQNANHMQLLQLTKQVNAPDPRVPPKPVAPRPTWGGMDVGWSNHP